MKTLMICGALCATAAALVLGPLRAAEMTTAGPMEATLICRAAGTGDHANAEMMTQSQRLVCKPLAMAMKMSDGSLRVIGTVTARKSEGPDLSQALTTQQVNDAWVGYLQREFHIDRSP